MKKALLIIDVQQFFLNQYTQHIWGKIGRYLDIHPYDAVFFSVFQNTTDSVFVKQLRREKCMSGEDLVLDKALSRWIGTDNVFFKRTYSLFKHAWFLTTIRQEWWTAFDVCGIDTNACIIATAFDWFDLGYTVTVLPELCASHSGYLYHDASIQIIDKCINKGILDHS